ncbi:histidine--tRNA ligase [Patescibacteria group bacterium]|nr:histidine--tRNA ligase [Patescibacteria group bacterium]
MIIPHTLKGFRDFLPRDARKRQYVINILKSVFELYGFEPLETPVLEYEEILAGKYGEEGEKLMYRFEDLGGRKVAMRYDQTVPLARVIAQFQNQISFPFKRYQIQPVWRADNTQRGRFREFLQCDIDTVGTESPLADAEIIATVLETYKKLGFKNLKLLLNDRRCLSNTYIKTSFDIPSEDIPHIFRALDKIKKIGEEGVLNELTQNNRFTQEQAKKILQNIKIIKPTEKITEILSLLEQFNIDKSLIEFSPTLVRGLDYYTGIIFEIIIEGYTSGSVGGGGRYDNLIGMFTNKQIPAVGFSFGFDRVIDAMQTLGLFPPEIAGSTTQVLVTIFSQELKNKSLAISNELRNNDINTESYLGEIKEKNPLEKQLKYADQKGIKNVIILGPEEAEKNIVTLKNLKTREQKKLTVKEAINLLRSI